jgi:hypothetical protein
MVWWLRRTENQRARRTAGREELRKVRQDLSGGTAQLKDNLAAERDHVQPDEQGEGYEVDQAALDAQWRSIKQRFLDDRERRGIGGWGRKGRL